MHLSNVCVCAQSKRRPQYIGIFSTCATVSRRSPYVCPCPHNNSSHYRRCTIYAYVRLYIVMNFLMAIELELWHMVTLTY